MQFQYQTKVTRVKKAIKRKIYFGMAVYFSFGLDSAGSREEEPGHKALDGEPQLSL